jgi:hypothetical protein
MLGLPSYIVDAVHERLLDGTSKREIERIVRAMVALENERRQVRNEQRATEGRRLVEYINLPEVSYAG